MLLVLAFWGVEGKLSILCAQLPPAAWIRGAGGGAMGMLLPNRRERMLFEDATETRPRLPRGQRNHNGKSLSDLNTLKFLPPQVYNSARPRLRRGIILQLLINSKKSTRICSVILRIQSKRHLYQPKAAPHLLCCAH